MSRTRTVILSAVGAAALVAAVAWGASATTASGRSSSPSGDPAAVDDSVFAAALGLTDDQSAAPDASSNGSPGHRGLGMRLGLHARMGMGPGMGLGTGLGMGLGMGGGLLHGEGVVKDRDGNFLTVATQGGTVTEVTASSVTVKSDDGYSRTWALTEDTKYWAFPDQATKSDLKAGVDVRIAGTVDGSTATARLVWFPPKPGTFPRPSWAPGHSGAPHPWGSERPGPAPKASGGGQPEPAPSASVGTSSDQNAA